MFFLAFVVVATMTTEAPKIVSVYRTLDECLVAKAAKNKTVPATGPNATDGPLRYFCLRAIPDA
jgi:glycine betaine/choline ABC-type transport system substrate-binding protein